MNVKLISNANKGSGDWCIVVVNGEPIYEGHNIGFCHLKELLEACNGFEYLTEHHLSDEEIDNWEEAIYQ